MRACLLLLAILAVQPNQEPVDPELKAAVERFFATQQAEDTAAYMALWSKTAKRPQLSSLQYIFDGGDDVFQDLEITRATISGDTARVRLAVTRVRSQGNIKNSDGTPRRFTSRLQWGLTYRREDGEWKLVREGRPGDELAEALVAEPSVERRAALLAMETDLANVRLVDSLGRIADEATVKQDYREAHRLYSVALEVARAIKDRKAEGLMLQNVANSLYFQRLFPAALATYEARLALEREAGNDDGIASALVGIATIKYSTFEYTTALAIYREALEIQERLGDRTLIGNTLISIANVLYLRGDFDAAAAEYRRAEAMKRAAYDLGGAAQALEGLGRTLAAQGDYAGALGAFGGVLDDSRKRKDIRRQASALSNIGDVHTRLVNLDAARTAYAESRTLHESAKDQAAAGRALQGTGVVELLSGRMPEAEKAYEQSVTLCTTALPRTDQECVARGHVGLGFARTAQEKWDPAIESYNKGIAAYKVLNATEAAARAQVGLAEALAGKEEFVSALATATDARHTGVALAADDLLWRALVSQARAQRRLKRAADAIGSARAAIGAVRGMATAALDRPSFSAPRDSTAAFITAAVLHAEAGDAVAAWDTVEEMRAFALRAALASQELELAFGMTPDERAAERAVAGELNPLLTQRDREKNLSPPDEARLKKLSAAIDSATAKRNAWLQQLFARVPELKVWRGLAPPARTEDLPALLKDPRDMWVQFVVDERDLLVLTAARLGDEVVVGAHLVPVKRQVLAETVAQTVQPTDLADGELWRKAAAGFVKMIPASVLDRMASANVVTIVPDDMLWRIPFEALPVSGGYLGDRAQVRYALSASAALRAPVPAPPVAPFTAAFVAAPRLPADLVEDLKTTAPSWTLRPVEEAQAEVAVVGEVLEKETTQVRSDEAATEDAFRAAAASATTLHVTGPFRLNAASPLFSPLLLTPKAEASEPTDASDNGVFEVREVATADVTARTLVVSDPAALTMRDAAASAATVYWVWRAAGTDTLMVRRWTSDPAATNALLAEFYKALRDGRTPADALHAAQAALRKVAPDTPPSVWAGWLVLSGR